MTLRFDAGAERGARHPPATPDELAAELGALRDEMRARFAASQGVLGSVHPDHRRSAQNLLDYLTLRSHDLRPVQESLARLGVSSLGRAEEHVIRSVEQVVAVLQALVAARSSERTEAAVGFGEGRRALEENAARLLGPGRPERATRIMVTMPAAAAGDETLVRRLVAAGMDCARVNCAHDTPEEWRAMTERIRRAADAEGRPCTVLADLPGPKLRTGPVADGPKVVRLRPRRDARGLAVVPASALLVAAPSGPALASGPRLPVPPAWLERLRPGAEVTLRDTRGSPRTLVVTATEPGAARVEAWDTTYLEPGTLLRARAGEAALGDLPATEQVLRVHVGDRLVLTGDLTPVRPPAVRTRGPARFRLGCTLPAALEGTAPGHQVWFDDGRIGGVVRSAGGGEVEVEVTLAGPDGTNLRAGRGINLPDSHLDLPSVSAADDAAVRFAAGHADLVGLSFAQRPSDVHELAARLAGTPGADLGVVLKIETAQGFHRLPELLLAAMAWRRAGVMVARGDLAVECGFERLAELQDEILWLCDAAHVPVVWATQVLDQMARTGQPSRAEVSDAVMAARAECVMLNKGPYIEQAVGALDGILRRMETHQRKKVPLLRRLRSWSPA